MFFQQFLKKYCTIGFCNCVNKYIIDDQYGFKPKWLTVTNFPKFITLVHSQKFLSSGCKLHRFLEGM